MRKKSLSAIGLSILGALLVVLVVVTVAAGFEVEAPETSHDSALTVIADGLDSPRHLTFGPDGALYVAEAGLGGEGPPCLPGPEEGDDLCLGDSGAITRITFTPAIAQQRVVTDLDSLAGEESPGGTVDAIGPHDILFDVTNGAGGSHDSQINGIGSMHVLFGLGASPTQTVPVTGALHGTSLAWITQQNVPGTLDNLVDIGAFELAANPDGHELDTNPFAFVRDDSSGTIYVADAGGNSVLSVASGTLDITTTAVFSDRLVDFFADFPANTIPISIPMQAVPTSIDIGPGGDLFVGQLTGFPFPVGGANVYKIPAGGGDPEVYKSGFTAIVDIEFDSSGNLYVLEMAKNGLLAGFGLGDWTGAVKRIDNTTKDVTTVAGSEELEAPTGLTIGPIDGALYISNKGIFPGEGEVVRIEPQARLRVAHLAPFDSVLADTAVDVKLNGTQVLTAFQYLSSTTYIEVPEDQYLVEVFPTGSMAPAITANVNLSNYVDYTAFAIGGANGYALTLKPEVDDNGSPAMGYGKVRFGHLAPFAFPESATLAEIRTDDGAPVAGPFEYGDIDDYIELPAGFYDLRVVTSPGGQTIIELFPFELNEGDILYAVAVGDGTNQAPGVFAYPTDVEGFLLPEEINIHFPVIFKQ